MPLEAPKELTKDDLEELLQRKVESFTSCPLTSPGENFGSLLLLVNATLLPDHQKLSIAAKLVVTKNLMGGVPPFRDFMRKEMDMYLRIRSEILAIQEEFKIPKELYLDVIPRCYGARTSRGGGVVKPVDETAVILMENLNVSGYRLVDRIVGMDLKHTECVVTHLARFQAMFVVFKLKKPDFFKNAVLPTTAEINHGPPPNKSDSDDSLTTMLRTTLSCVPAVVENIDRIKVAIIKARENVHIKPLKKLENPTPPSSTMTFGQTILKLIDFQMTSYGSPATDLISFLYSSTSLDVTKDDRIRLIKLYHQEFTKWLELFGCDTTPFSYEAFMKEVEIVAPLQFMRVLFMLRIFCMSKSNPPDINNPAAFHKMKTDNTGLGEIYFNKIERLVRESIEMNWI
ncbi:hypothetical protein PR048_031129 [Dryococelus australis]|uniref:CHK kinase-like domain-containing protein n=1 Tax=Dryococelus australis TaxID=614101 RepID=A0ABQ9G7I5_9NEOP|nr:hypothetical protein PR048_031129 [Dryococelus australis]